MESLAANIRIDGNQVEPFKPNLPSSINLVNLKILLATTVIPVVDVINGKWRTTIQVGDKSYDSKQPWRELE